MRKRYIFGTAYNQLECDFKDNLSVKADKYNDAWRNKESSSGRVENIWNSEISMESDTDFFYHHPQIRLNALCDNLNLSGKPLLLEHDKNKIIGKILGSWIVNNNSTISILAEINDPEIINHVDNGEMRGLSIGYIASLKRGLGGREEETNNYGSVEKYIEEVSVCKTPYFNGCEINLLASKKNKEATPLFFLQKNNFSDNNDFCDYILKKPSNIHNILLMQSQPSTPSVGSESSPPPQPPNPPQPGGGGTSSLKNDDASFGEKMNIEGLTREKVLLLVQKMGQLQENNESLMGKLNQLENVNKEYTSAKCKEMCDSFDNAFGKETIGEDGQPIKSSFMDKTEREMLEAMMLDYQNPHLKTIVPLFQKVARAAAEHSNSSKKKSSPTPSSSSSGGATPKISSPLTNSFTLQSGQGSSGTKRSFDKMQNDHQFGITASKSSSGGGGGNIPIDENYEAFNKDVEAKKIMALLNSL